MGSANAGGIIKAGIEPRNEYLFEYEIRFDNLFPWSKGGKIPGLSGGAGYTGGVPATAGDGFSVRIMWREGGRLIPYVYHYNQPDNFGDTFGVTLGYVDYTTTHKIKYHVKLNTGADPNGILQIWLNDALVLRKTDLVYRTDTSSIDTAHLAIFPGGSDETWNMTGDGYIRLPYVKWEPPVYSEFTLTEKPTDIPNFTSTGTQEFQANFTTSGEQAIPVFAVTATQEFQANFTASGNEAIPVLGAAAIQEKTGFFNQAATNTMALKITATATRKINFLTFGQSGAETIAPFAVTATAEKIEATAQTYAAEVIQFMQLTVSAKAEGTHFSPYETEVFKPNSLFEPTAKDRAIMERSRRGLSR